MSDQELDRILKKLNDFAVDSGKAVDQTVRKTGLKIKSDAVKAINTHSVGTVYPRNGGKYHVASKPGDAPNTDSGRLIGDIRMIHKKDSQEAQVGTDLDYGAFLELLMNRPWLNPAFEKNIDDFAKNLEKNLDRQIKQAGK